MKRYTNLDGTSCAMLWRHLPGYFWRRFSPRGKSARQREGWELERVRPDLSDEGDFLVWLGHSTFLIRICDKWLLTDPVLGELSGFSRLAGAPVESEEVPPIDYLLISHGHADHFDPDTIESLEISRAVIPVGLERIGREALQGAAVTELDWGDRERLGDLSVAFLPAQHSYQRTLFDRDLSLWGSFLIEWQGKKIFFCGDSGLANHFGDIGQKHGPIDYCLMPIGAYNPSWLESRSHVNPEESLQAFEDLRGRVFIPMHYGTFDLSDEPYSEPLERLLRTNTGADVRVLKIGERFPLV